MELLGETSASEINVPECAAASLLLRLEQHHNAGAIAEAAAATDELQLPDEIRDQDGSQYNNTGDSEVPDVSDVNCKLCGGEAGLSSTGLIAASKCVVSASCEKSWAEMHPEQFKEDGKLKVRNPRCGGGYGCNVVLDLSEEDGERKAGRLGVAILSGTCTVDLQGAKWKQSSRAILNGMQPQKQREDELEEFDGETLSEENEV